MDWEVVRIDDTAKGRTQPAASLGFGRITFNTAACKLLGDYRRYRYVELMRDQGGSPQVGVRFLLEGERTGNSLPIRQRVANGQLIGGLDIAGKRVLVGLFGVEASAEKVTRYSVRLAEDRRNILVICRR